MKLTLNDDLTCNNLILNESVDTNEHNLICNVMLIETSASSTIDISNSQIDVCMIKINDPNNNILPDSVFSGNLHIGNVYYGFAGSMGTTGPGTSGTSSMSIGCSGSCILNSVTIESPLTYITGTLYTDQFYSDGVGENNVLSGGYIEEIIHELPSEPIFLLNFEGEEGSTTWIEEIQGLQPDYAWTQDATIDTSKYYSGTSCLKLGSGGGEIDYIVPNIGSDFTIYTYMFINSDIDNDINIICLVDQDGAAAVGIYLTSYNSITEIAGIGLYGRDNNTDLFNTYYTDVSLPINTWNKFECIVSGSELVVKINDSVLTSYTSSVVDPFLGLDYFYIYNGSSYSVYFDKINMESTSTSSSSTFIPWNIISYDESINVTNTTLIGSSASGSSTFYSFFVDGCFDGGDNTGWIFDGMRYTFTNVQENHTLDVNFSIPS
jgi:hypothetical protein